MKLNVKLFMAIFFLSVANLYAIPNIFRHSEIASPNSIFVDVAMYPLFLNADTFEFNLHPLNIRVTYMLPLPLPFSLGAFMETPNPNLRNFGLRLAYHVDLLSPRTDLYFVYSFNFGFIRNELLLRYNDRPVDIHYYDFRIGIRHFFRNRFGAAVETGFKLESIIFMFSLKIN